jgi:transcriptional regulator with XRE-family HTH domain
MRPNTDTTETPLRRIRLRREVSQRALAAAADCAISTIWIAERSGYVSERMARRFAAALGCSVDDLLPAPRRCS